MERCDVPFLHFVTDGFISSKDEKSVHAVYERCVFKELHTDLFRFLQTDELGQEKSLDFFRDILMKMFKGMGCPENGWIDMFGSYYVKGNYLLCHDDRVGERMFAYTYYLETYDSGELILYENDCETVSKRIAVKRNRLVVFEVSDKSFHEVGYCEKDGRKAFTGWINFENIKHSMSIPEAPTYSLLNFTILPLEVVFDEDNILFYPEVEYDFDYVSKAVEGPFCSRRLERLVLENPIVPSMDDWSLHDGGFYHFRVGDYILLNDRCNRIGGDTCDIFFVSSEKENPNTRDYDKTFCDVETPIKYLDKDGRFACSIPVFGRNMFIVKRGDLSLFVERCQEEFFLAHFIYKKTSTA